MRKFMFSLWIWEIVVGALPVIAAIRIGGAGIGSIQAAGDGDVHIRGNTVIGAACESNRAGRPAVHPP